MKITSKEKRAVERATIWNALTKFFIYLAKICNNNIYRALGVAREVTEKEMALPADSITYIIAIRDGQKVTILGMIGTDEEAEKVINDFQKKGLEILCMRVDTFKSNIVQTLQQESQEQQTQSIIYSNRSMEYIQ
jgi:hypothetical protein